MNKNPASTVSHIEYSRTLIRTELRKMSEDSHNGPMQQAEERDPVSHLE
jgi:hypothetical protein